MKERIWNLQNGENLSSSQLHVVELGNEHCGHTLEDGCAIHVHSGPMGRMNRLILLSTPLFSSMHFIIEGRVAELGNANHQIRE